MSALPIHELVAARIAEDKAQSADIARTLTEKNELFTDQKIRAFFPEFDTSSAANQRSNLPAGVPLIHHLLVGLPTVFDLEPLTVPQFEERYRISIRTAEELVEAGRLLPNLYARSPEQWHGFNHFQGLVQRSTVNGERVDAYLRARDDRYDDYRERRSDILSRQLGILEQRDKPQADFFVADSRSPRETACRVMGTRWAYLDILAPSASEHVAGLVEDTKLRQAADFIRTTKHLYVSPITAAIGGHFTWGKRDIATLHTVGVRESIPPWVYKDTHFQQKKDALEYLVHEITGVSPFGFLKDFQAELLLEVIRREEFGTLKYRLYETMETMARLARQGEVDTGTVEEWKSLAEAIREEIDKYQRRGRIASNAAIYMTTGFLIDGLFGLGFAAIVQSFLSEFVSSVGPAIHQAVNADRHRFVVQIDKLRSS